MRAQSHRFVENGDGLLFLPRVNVDAAEISVSLDVAGVLSDSALELDDGFIVADMYHDGENALGEASVPIVGIDRERLLHEIVEPCEPRPSYRRREFDADNRRARA